MKEHPVLATYRGRDQMTLVEFVEDVEEVHFRTPFDTGANPNAMMIWNMVRQQAGLPALERDDLIHNQARHNGTTYEQEKKEVDAYDARDVDDYDTYERKNR